MKSVKDVLSLFLILMFFVSCGEDDCCANRLQGRFVHEIPDCTEEQTCTEFVHFLDASRANIRFDGGDTAYRFDYRVEDGEIFLEQEPTSSFALPFHFRIVDSRTLIRSDNGDLWKKE
ncbi:hypothetical protein [Ulvibacterium sp.]|uniref:hypothetical protein n=1 Tax=Ulvibacterium sp. TaxID=2665914 RepID=UPI002624C770|nr:hypothetical protein [Ulvibacterium sp.]